MKKKIILGVILITVIIFYNRNLVYNVFYKIKNPNDIVLPLTTDETNVLYCDINVNGITKKFVLDTGCSTMLISKKEAKEILKRNKINKTIYDKTEVNYANGENDILHIILIDEIKIGNETLNNIPCVISNNENSPLLLGQSLFSKFNYLTIDYTNMLLILKK